MNTRRLLHPLVIPALAIATLLAMLHATPPAAHAAPPVQDGADCEALNQEGVNLFYQAEYSDAVQKWEDALACYQEIGDRQGEGKSLGNLGVAYFSMGQYTTAIEYYEQALAISRDIDDRQGEGTGLGNLGIAYRSMGQYVTAIEYYEQALAISRDIGDRRNEGVWLGNLGTAYDSLGQYATAIEYYEQALAISRDIDDRRNEGTWLGNLGVAYDSLGQYATAIEYCEQALAIARDIGNRAGEGRWLGHLGLAYGDLGQYATTIEYHEQALAIARDIGDRNMEGSTLGNLGNAYWSMGQYATAIEYYEQALAIARDIGNRSGEGTWLGNLGLAYRNLGQYATAIEYYEQAIAVIETMRTELGVEEFKSSFAAQYMSPYRGMIAALIELSRFEEAFHYAQRAKARTFLDQVGNARIDPRATDDPMLVEQEQTLLAEIRALEAVLAGRSNISTLDTTRGGPPPLTSNQRGEVQERLEDAYREYEHTLAQIKLTNPEYAALRSVQASTLITVQQTLPANVTLLEYYVAPTQTLAFVVTQDEFHTIPISVTAEALNQKIDWFRQFPSLEGVPQASQDLYNLLLAPVRKHIHTQSILIAPHLWLHYLPFGALHDGEHYLIEDYTIAYIPSGSVLQYVTPREQGGGGAALVLGNPDTGDPDLASLTYAEREAEAIAVLFDGQAFTGADATETLLWEQTAQAGYVHLAAHGQFNPIAPQFSRIYLAPDDANDGLLEVREVWNLPLENADLVTLSACETQLGDPSSGDELVGLSRAFIYAGTPSLVATLWSVDDASTRFLMERFYGYLKEGQGKASALRQAQLDTMKEYPSPYYWAAFTLIGDMGEVEPVATASRIWLWLAGGGALLLILIGGGIWTRKVRK